jgi:hypothetical protein
MPTAIVTVLDILLSRMNAEVAEDSNVAKPDCNDNADITALSVFTVALPEITDCEVLSTLLDKVALPLVTNVEGRSTFTDTVA